MTETKPYSKKRTGEFRYRFSEFLDFGRGKGGPQGLDTMMRHGFHSCSQLLSDGPQTRPCRFGAQLQIGIHRCVRRGNRHS